MWVLSNEGEASMDISTLARGQRVLGRATGGIHNPVEHIEENILCDSLLRPRPP